MSLSLSEALSQVELEPGRTYRCLVNGKRVELRVQEQISAELLPAPLNEAEVMLEPWVELPVPTGGKRLRGKPGQLPPPDVPKIPDEDEGE